MSECESVTGKERVGCELVNSSYVGDDGAGVRQGRQGDSNHDICPFQNTAIMFVKHILIIRAPNFL